MPPHFGPHIPVICRQDAQPGPGTSGIGERLDLSKGARDVGCGSPADGELVVAVVAEDDNVVEGGRVGEGDVGWRGGDTGCVEPF